MLERVSVETFLNCDILKYFPLKKVAEDSPLFGALVPINKGRELNSFWGSEGDSSYRIHNIHQWISDPSQDQPLTYFSNGPRSKFYHLMGYISNDPILKYSTNLIVMRTDLYVEFSQEFTEWDYRVRLGKLGYNPIIHKIIKKEIIVDFSSHCNKGEILVLDTSRFEILIGIKEKDLRWNLACLSPRSNRKFIMRGECYDETETW